MLFGIMLAGISDTYFILVGLILGIIGFVLTLCE